MTNPETARLILKLVDSMSDWAVLTIDLQGNLQSWNSNAVVLFGYERAEVEGRHFSFLYTPYDISTGEPSAELKATATKGSHRDFGSRIDKKGNEIECEFGVYPLPDDGGQVVGYLYFVRGRGPEELPASVAATPALEKRETILVVDDDDGVRAVAARKLARLGYDVIEASNGSEALAVLGKGTKVDLLFTDVMMPQDIGGRDLAVEAQKLCPNLRVLFASGYFEGALTQRGDLERNVYFIAKPYRKAQLAQKVREVLSTKFKWRGRA